MAVRQSIAGIGVLDWTFSWTLTHTVLLYTGPVVKHIVKCSEPALVKRCKRLFRIEHMTTLNEINFRFLEAEKILWFKSLDIVHVINNSFSYLCAHRMSFGIFPETFHHQILNFWFHYKQSHENCDPHSSGDLITWFITLISTLKHFNEKPHWNKIKIVNDPWIPLCKIFLNSLKGTTFSRTDAPSAKAFQEISVF